MGSNQDHRHIEFAVLDISDLESTSGRFGGCRRLCGLCCCRSRGATSRQDHCCYDCQKQELTHCLLLLKESVGMEQTTTKNLFMFGCTSFHFKDLLSIQLYIIVRFDILIVGQIT